MRLSDLSGRRPRALFADYLALSAGLCAVAANYLCISLQSHLAQNADETAPALRLVDTFITNYSRVRAQFGPNSPVPATFRANAIDAFNKQAGSLGAIQVVGSIEESIREISRYTAAVASSVDEQSTATSEISANVGNSAPRHANVRFKGPLTL